MNCREPAPVCPVPSSVVLGLRARPLISEAVPLRLVLFSRKIELFQTRRACLLTTLYPLARGGWPVSTRASASSVPASGCYRRLLFLSRARLPGFLRQRASKRRRGTDAVRELLALGSSSLHPRRRRRGPGTLEAGASRRQLRRAAALRALLRGQPLYPSPCVVSPQIRAAVMLRKSYRLRRRTRKKRTGCVSG